MRRIITSSPMIKLVAASELWGPMLSSDLETSRLQFNTIDLWFHLPSVLTTASVDASLCYIVCSMVYSFAQPKDRSQLNRRFSIIYCRCCWQMSKRQSFSQSVCLSVRVYVSCHRRAHNSQYVMVSVFYRISGCKTYNIFVWRRTSKYKIMHNLWIIK